MSEITKNLFKAIEEKNLATIKQCLEDANLDINYQDDDYQDTPLMVACELGEEAIVDLLLEHDDIDVNHSKYGYGTPLIRAVENNHITIVAKLLQQKHTDINITDVDNQSPLVIAICNKNLTIFDMLLNSKRKLDLHIQSYFYGTALTAAIFHEQYDMAEKLLALEKTFDTNKHPGAFLWAIRKNQIKLVNLLIDNGADVNVTGEEGYNEPPDYIWHAAAGKKLAFSRNPLQPSFNLPIIEAMKCHSLEITHILLIHGADLDTKGYMGTTPREYINYLNNAEDFKKIIIEYESKPKIGLASTENTRLTDIGFFSSTSNKNNMPTITQQDLLAKLEKINNIRTLFEELIQDIEPTASNNNYVIKTLDIKDDTIKIEVKFNENISIADKKTFKKMIGSVFNAVQKQLEQNIEKIEDNSNLSNVGRPTFS